MSDKSVDISLYSIPADYDAVAGMTQQENTKVSLQVAIVGGGCKACPGICDNILRGFDQRFNNNKKFPQTLSYEYTYEL